MEERKVVWIELTVVSRMSFSSLTIPPRLINPWVGVSNGLRVRTPSHSTPGWVFQSFFVLQNKWYDIPQIFNPWVGVSVVHCRELPSHSTPGWVFRFMTYVTANTGKLSSNPIMSPGNEPPGWVFRSSIGSVHGLHSG